MNIQEAKETIEKALRAYFARDEIGFPLVPLRQQRPILLIGPPGIGKTAIMEQIAEECGVGLVAYTMTHHTRQSAMGLPEICTREIEGKTVHTTEYTMSEIIASIYDCMEQTGKKRGILFLDEINCVSETLAPVMLQLLQDKKFGNQHIPDDWLIVAAGNPPEYNKSVREFDVATLDRVRKIEVVPELSVWLSYAEKNQIHGAVTTYLMAHSDHFYSVSQEADEKRFVTARGWEDLSAVLKSYEILHFPVDEALIGQYLQEEKDGGGIQLVLQDLRKIWTGLRCGGDFDRCIFRKNHGRKTADGGKWFRRRAICTAVSVSCGTSERGIRLPEAGAHGKGAFRVLAPVYRTLQAEKRRNVSFLAAAERAGICSVQTAGTAEKGRGRNECAGLEKVKKTRGDR